MNLRQIDPNHAFLEGAQKLVGMMVVNTDPEDKQYRRLIPWRTGPDGEYGVPVRLVAEAVGLPVEEVSDLLQGQTVMGEPVLFIGRQGPEERITIGAMGDEECVTLLSLPSIIGKGVLPLGGHKHGLLLRLEAASVANLLERLAGVKATA